MNRSATPVAGASPRVLVYGDMNLNVVDGSAVWLQSLASVLVLAGAEVHLQLKVAEERTVLTGPLREIGVRIHKPPRRFAEQRIRAEDAVAMLEATSKAIAADVVILRGFDVATATAAVELPPLWVYLTDIPQRLEELTMEARRRLQDIFGRAARVVCQTEELRAFLVSQFPDVDASTLLLPPMIPERLTTAPEWADRGPRVMYAGKFAPAWAIEELVQTFGELLDEIPDAHLRVAGDKFHKPPDDPGYEGRLTAALLGSGVEWVGALRRDEVQASMRSSAAGWSVRDRVLDDSLEISTKILEYAANGCPPIVNRTQAHVDLLGIDYPYLCDGPTRAAAQLEAALQGGEAWERAAHRAWEVSARYTYDAAAARLRPFLERHERRPYGGRPITLGLVGHDLKFTDQLVAELERSDVTVAPGIWGGHPGRDASMLDRVLADSDVVIAEWCLAAAAAASERTARPGTPPLLVRFHRTELNSHHPENLDLSGVARIVFVAEHVRRQACRRFGWPVEQTTVIPNLVDVPAFDRPKLPGASLTLGLLGWVPALKRLDRALDVLAALRLHDRGYRLSIKGTPPWDYEWVWKQPAEREYYEAQLHRIRTDPFLREAVTFERAGGDVASWLRSVGFVLSTSDVESTHLAAVEGLASGAEAVVFEREGAADLLGPGRVVADADAAAALILGTDLERGGSARRAVAGRYDRSVVGDAWRALLAEVVG